MTSTHNTHFALAKASEYSSRETHVEFIAGSDKSINDCVLGFKVESLGVPETVLLDQPNYSTI